MTWRRYCKSVYTFWDTLYISIYSMTAIPWYFSIPYSHQFITRVWHFIKPNYLHSAVSTPDIFASGKKGKYLQCIFERFFNSLIYYRNISHDIAPDCKLFNDVVVLFRSWRLFIISDTSSKFFCKFLLILVCSLLTISSFSPPL